MKDPAFLFYPGDYLRDTQCLSEAAQTSYDRIMCEHMRNICISQDQLNFFTKRLTPDQKSEVMMVLTKVLGGYQIAWVAESIEKRRNYSDSRRKNREGKPKKKETYVPHMENEIVIENESEILIEYENWTKSILEGKDQFFEQMFMQERIPSGEHIQYWVLDHRDLLNRYPKMRPPNQQAFRKSCIKHIRENFKKPINGTANGINKKQQQTDELIISHAKRWGSNPPQAREV
jgi:hypothetical protein